MWNRFWSMRSSSRSSYIDWQAIEMPLASQPTVHHMSHWVHPQWSTIRRIKQVDEGDAERKENNTNFLINQKRIRSLGWVNRNESIKMLSPFHWNSIPFHEQIRIEIDLNLHIIKNNLYMLRLLDAGQIKMRMIFTHGFQLWN